jgi:hypothetical protein
MTCPADMNSDRSYGLTDEQIANFAVQILVDQARRESWLLGTVKYLYYMSPLGYMLANPKHEMAWAITRAKLAK